MPEMVFESTVHSLVSEICDSVSLDVESGE